MQGKNRWKMSPISVVEIGHVKYYRNKQSFKNTNDLTFIQSRFNLHKSKLQVFIKVHVLMTYLR